MSTKKFQIEEYIDKLAQEMIDYHDRLRKIVEPLSSEEIELMIAECNNQAEGKDNRNFNIPEWKVIADNIAAELFYRDIVKRAQEHKDKTGSDFYCLECGGDCKPGHFD